MIIISSNRNVHPNKQGHEIFGNKFSGLGNRFATVKFVEDEPEYIDWDEDEELYEPEDWWEVDLCDAGKESELFQEIVQKIDAGDEELERPWVFFLHGNNQSFEKNLKKCHKIQALYDVNVFAFSWPSMPRTFTKSLFDVVRGYIKPEEALSYIRTGDIDLSDITSGGVVTGLIKNKYTDYKIAKRRAKDSSDAFMASVQSFYDHIFTKSNSQIKASFIVHSLGNHVVESLDIEEFKDKIPEAFFSNVIFHQADVHASEYKGWISEKANAFGGKHYVTINEHDWVLLISMMANRKRRLGQATYSHDIAHINYIDFTYGVNVGSNHTMFTTKEKSNKAIFDLFTQLSRSETEINITELGYESLPDSMLYRLAERRIDENIWGESEDDD